MRAPNAVLLFGSPGSGKSTQAALLADTLAYEVLDAGVILSKAVHDPARQSDQEIVEELRRYDAGELASTDFFAKEVLSKLKELEEQKTSCVLSGWPRKLEQAEAVIPHIVDTYGIPNIHVVIIDVPKEVNMLRSKTRRTCKVCGRPQLTLELDANPPTHCRVCGGELFVRTDIAAFEHRYEVYENETEPVFGYLTSLGLSLTRVDGSQGPAFVYEDIVKAIT